MLHKYNLRSAGYLEVQKETTDGDIRVNALPASSGTWRRSIKTNEPMSLGSIHGSRPQNTTVRAISTTACRSLATEGVILEPHRQMTKEKMTTTPTSKIDSWKIASLNVKEKRYLNRKSKYKDIATTIRLKDHNTCNTRNKT